MKLSIIILYVLVGLMIVHQFCVKPSIIKKMNYWDRLYLNAEAKMMETVDRANESITDLNKIIKQFNERGRQ